MKKLTLIDFTGRSNYFLARELVEGTGFDYQVVCQDKMEDSDPLR